MTLVCGDSLPWLKRQKANAFSAACFSPPYAASGRAGFDARCDFRAGGRFLPYALELSRAARVWGANFTQLVYAGELLPFTEELTLALREEGVRLFDRWVMYKPAAKPQRGNRALTNFEFLLLFARDSGAVPRPQCRVLTAFPATHERRATGVSQGSLGLTPYARALPLQLFSAYGGPEPVLDPFCGSGTSLLAAQQLNLRYAGVDIEPRNVALCRERGLR